MSLTFPNSPSTNDTHTTGGSSWIFDGEKWVRQGTTGPQGIQGLQGNQGIQGLSNQGVQGLQGLMGIQGRQGVQGTDGADGNFGGATFDYTFDTSNFDGDPGTGKLRLNNSTVSSATALYIDVEDDNGTDISSFLTTIDDSTSTIKGHFRISNRLNADDFALFTISSASSQQGAYYSVSCGYVSGSASSFSNNEDVIITFARTGDKGDTGATGSQGVQGLQGLKGSQGVQGLSNQGVQGLQGILGTAGSAGAAGAQGTTGTAGSNGSNGAQGTAGTAAGGGVGVDYDDNIKVRFGDDEDIEQFFDGTRFKIQPKTSTTTSQLDFEVKDQIYIHSTSNGIFLRGSNQNIIDMYGGSGGGIYFHHNGNDKLKLEGGNWTTQGDADWNFIGTNYDIRFDASDGALEFEDNAKAKFGTSDDLQIYHDGANSYVSDQGTGDLRLSGNVVKFNNQANTATMIKATQGGSVELNHDNSKRFETIGTGVTVTGTTFTDQLSVSGIATAGQVILDGTLFMNGGASVSSIQSKTTNGSLQIKVLNQGGGNSAELIQLRGTGNLISANFRPDSGVQLYGRTGSNSAAVRLETNSTGVDVTGLLDVSSSARISGASVTLDNSASYGNQDYSPQLFFKNNASSNNFYIWKDNTNNMIEVQGTDDLIIRARDLGSDIKLESRTSQVALKVVDNAAVELYHGANGKKLETTSGGISVTGDITCTQHIDLGDSQELRLGASDDLKIYHDGTNSRIKNVTGQLWLQSDNGIRFTDADVNESMAAFYDNGAVELYYDGTKRFETTSDGVKITGGLQDKDGQLGSSGQVLSSTGTQLNWVDADSGPQGVQGLKGTTGNTGSTGSTGSTGAQGIAGSDGTNGSNGSNGAQGTQGSAGSNGSNGSNGAQGTQGSAGSNGSNGSNGAQGTAGSITLSNNSNNRIVTATGGATANAESNLTFDGSRLQLTGDNGIYIRSSTNNVGAKLQFSDHASGSYAQNGTIQYKHSDGSVTTTGGNSNDGWIVSGTEARTVFKVEGDIEATSNVYASSDISLKDNIVTYENALDKVLALRGVEYDRNDLDGVHEVGLIAQEVEEIIPELVGESRDGLKNIAYGKLTAVLVEAVKELKKENDALSARIKSLEDR